MDSIEILSIEHYLNLVDSFKGNSFFRGQASDWNEIVPGVCRNKGWMKQEYLMFQEMLGKERGEFEQNELLIKKLFKMQHYGLPTRLCDISKSPLISLYFAVDNDEYCDDYGKVFVINGLKVLKTDDERIKAISYLTTLNSKNIKDFTAKYNEYYNQNKQMEDVKNALQQDVIIEVGYDDHNERSFIQAGSTIIFGYHINENLIIRELKRFLDSKYIQKMFLIPPYRKPEIKKALNEKYGICENSVLLGMESTAKSIKDINWLDDKSKVNNVYDFTLDERITFNQIKIDVFVNLKGIHSKIIIKNVIQEIYVKVQNRCERQILLDNKKLRVYGFFYLNENDKRHSNWTCMTALDDEKKYFSYNDNVSNVLIKWLFDADIWRIVNINQEISARIIVDKITPVIIKAMESSAMLYGNILKYEKGEFANVKLLEKVEEINSILSHLRRLDEEIPHGRLETHKYREISSTIICGFEDSCDTLKLNLKNETVKFQYAVDSYKKEYTKIQNCIKEYEIELKKVNCYILKTND